MATYIDTLSMIMNDEVDPDAPTNECLELLNSWLFSYTDYVILVMNWRKSEVFDYAMAEKCILYLWRRANGMADIKSCCKVFLESLDDITSISDGAANMVQRLIRTYDCR